MKIFSRILTVIALIAAIGAPAANGAITATSVLDNTASKISGMPSLTADFSIAEQGRAVPGKITLSGNKFAMTTTGSQSAWYDGKTQWVYNPAVNEMSITTPTAEELAMVNPFHIIQSFKKSFTAKLLTAPAGSHVVELSAIAKKSEIRTVVITVNASTSLPSKVVITTRDGQKATITISNIKRGSSLPASKFAPAKKSYPKAEWIDLR